MNRKGFTLIELLVVVAVITILMAILLPALGTARSQAQMVKCAANLKRIGTAMNVYATEYDGSIVPAIVPKIVSPTATSIPASTNNGGTLNRYWWDLLWDYLGMPANITTFPNRTAIMNTGNYVLHCPSYKPEVTTWRGYAANQEFHPTGIGGGQGYDQHPTLSGVAALWRFKKITSIPDPVAVGFVSDAGFYQDRLWLSNMVGALATPYANYPGGLPSTVHPDNRHRQGSAINAVYLDSHVEVLTPSQIPMNRSNVSDSYNKFRFWGRDQ